MYIVGADWGVICFFLVHWVVMFCLRLPDGKVDYVHLEFYDDWLCWVYLSKVSQEVERLYIGYFL